MKLRIVYRRRTICRLSANILSWCTAVITSLAGAGTATAQRADENAVIAAKDAFGTSIGYQDVGLYSPNDARGFSPQQAGNLRIEGLYFDQQTWATSECMVRETTMRVGFAAQSYSFPAPTGIAEISLRTPGDTPLSSVVLTRGPFNTVSVNAETQIPLVDHTLGVDLCAGYRRNFEVDVFHQPHEALFGATFRWRPTSTTEIVPFWSYVVGGARQIVPGVYTDGTVSPPQFRTQDLATQDWTTWGWHSTTFGALAKSTLGDHWEFAGGLFHSREHDPLGYQPYLTLVTSYTADSAVDVVPPFTADSTSGELRLSRTFTNGDHRQQLQLAVRGRSVDRDFGGDAIIDFGNIPLNSQTSLAQPPWTFTAQSRDTTRQLDLGLTFEERWQGVGSAAVGVLRDHYRRQVTVPTAPVVTDDTTPWLLNLRLEADGSHHLTIYGSFVQGLEDSALAPVSAANRNEPPPATRTWQVDSGIRWVPTETAQLILGAFEIHKPYFNLDAGNVYTQIGWVQYRGLETSLSFSHAGLTMLAGGVLLKPQVERVIAEPGATGNIPLGPVPLTLTTNLDYAPPRWGPWAASLQWDRLSSRVATTDNSIYLLPLATLGAGVRYHLTLLAHPWTARLDGYNLTNASGLHVSSLYLLLPEQSRRFMLTLAIDL
jgi:iron complex outermembrane receptor protein